MQPQSPATVLDRLKAIAAEVSSLVKALDRPAPAVPHPTERGRGGSRPALLQNPFVGFADKVTTRQVPARKGGTVPAWTIHTGAAKFETFSETITRQVCNAIRAGEPVCIYWQERRNGRYTNYDVTRLNRTGGANG